MREWSPTRILIAIVLFIIVAVAARTLAGSAYDLLVSMHGGGGARH